GSRTPGRVGPGVEEGGGRLGSAAAEAAAAAALGALDAQLLLADLGAVGREEGGGGVLVHGEQGEGVLHVEGEDAPLLRAGQVEDGLANARLVEAVFGAQGDVELEALLAFLGRLGLARLRDGPFGGLLAHARGTLPTLTGFALPALPLALRRRRRRRFLALLLTRRGLGPLLALVGEEGLEHRGHEELAVGAVPQLL